ncbi:MAG: DNA mismatch repair protein MutS, partial [Planctomycetota bacterium]
VVESRPGWQFSQRHGLEELSRCFGVSTAAGFGFDDEEPALAATGAGLSYLEETQRAAVSHLRPPTRHEPSDFLRIDPASFRSLEIDRTIRSGTVEGSLVHAVDRTKTPMGGRTLRDWLRAPLTDLAAIQNRQETVAALKSDPPLLRELTKQLGDICDIERIVGRLALNRASPRDLHALGCCLKAIPALLDTLSPVPNAAPGLPEMADFCSEQASFLTKAIADDPPPHLRDGGVIAKGFSQDLDELRNIGRDSKTWLAGYQKQLAEETQIPSLKIGFNKVFGYYIEVTHVHAAKAPQAWSRRQSTKNAERYITDELKAFEEKALGAEEKSVALEQQLFEQVRNDLLPHTGELQELAGHLARLDVLAGFATLSLECNYCQPQITEDRTLEIEGGRHPVLDQTLGSEFVANDVRFGDMDGLQLITGPNMAGKSTFIRQVALIALLAQCGSDVPASRATVGIVDKLFARVGASDELHAGQSTFMVEMTETANLLHNATDRSLVILDEIGRGTSTLDGLSLAWSIAEHVAKASKCRCLFATHYHELTKLEETMGGVRNLSVSVREWNDDIIFLHRIVDGAASQSYGIQVAKLAGVPRPVVERAGELLQQLKVQHAGDTPAAATPSDLGKASQQMALFAIDDTPPALKSIAKSLSEIDPDELSPKQAHAKLAELRQRLGE